MNKIPSFEKNHNTLMPGLHESGTANGVTTWDLRFKRPNCGDFLEQAALHSIEHMLATILRSSDKKDGIVYFGPMGCRTGFYLLTVGMNRAEVVKLLKQSFTAALELDFVPGAKQEECGNYLEHDIDGAKAECKKYIEILNSELVVGTNNQPIKN
ncbi:MAG: S-ribosylhomocysteine lyase [Clostridiales bacterium]|nr:S-ribosylhomocysteine lyase [Clostridiales bacterium]